MTYLVIGGDSFFALANDAALARRSGDDAIYRLFQFAHADLALISSRCQDSCLVEQISKISSRKTGSLFRQRFQRYTGLQGFSLGMNLQNGNTPANIWTVKYHLPIKAPGAQQGALKYIGTVRSTNPTHATLSAQPIHLTSNLHTRLLS